MTTERQSDKTVSDIEVQMKQRSFTELLHDVKIAIIDIHQCLLNVCGDQPVDVSAVRGVFQQWWQWCERQTTFWIAMHRCHATKWRLFWPAHPQESENYYHVTVYGAECQLQCTRNNGGNTGILQCLCQIVPTNAHMGTERTSYAHLSGPVEQIKGWRWWFPGSHYYWWQDVVSLLQAGAKTAVHGVNFSSKKKLKTQPSVGKIIRTVFWDRKGVILELGQINSDCYIIILTKLKASRVRPEMKIPFLLQHDNAMIHTSLKTVEHITNHIWIVLGHPPYSLDLALSIYSGWWTAWAVFS